MNQLVVDYHSISWEVTEKRSILCEGTISRAAGCRTNVNDGLISDARNQGCFQGKIKVLKVGFLLRA